jgi:HK97 family phage portal protein
MNIFKRLFQRKSAARSALVINEVGRAAGSDRNYEAFAKEGYRINPVVFRCVNLLARSAMRVPMKLMKMDRGEVVEIKDHEILDIMYKPNPMQGYAAFIEEFIAFYTLAGNSFIEAKPKELTDENRLEYKKEPPTELWVIPPYAMNVIKGLRGLPLGYLLNAVGKEIKFPVDQIEGKSRIMHMKTFHPLNMWVGMAPMEAASYSVDTHNEAGQWNYSLLKNSASPSGTIEIDMEMNGEGTLTDTQRSQLKQEIKDLYSGSRNMGRPMVLERGMKYTPISFNMRDLDFISGKNLNSREISLVFGVPEQLVGVPESQKYDNNMQAKTALYTDTVIPLMDCLVDQLNNWLVPHWNDPSIYLQLSTDNIQALEALREKKWTQVTASSFLTTNEKREHVGLGRYDEEAKDAGDKILVNAGLVALEFVAGDPSEDLTDTEDVTGDPEDEDENEDDDNDKGFEFDLKEIKGPAEARSKWLSIDRTRRKFERTLSLQLQHVFNKEKKDMVDAFRTIDPTDDKLVEFAINQVLDDNEENFSKVLTKNMRVAMEEFGAGILEVNKNNEELFLNLESKDARSKFDSFLEMFIKDHVGDKIKRIKDTSKRRLKEVVKVEVERGLLTEGTSNAEISKNVFKKISKKYKGFTKARSMTIARTETAVASSVSTRKAADFLSKDTGIKLMKEWVPSAYQEDRSRDNHQAMRGKKVGIDEMFLVPTDTGIIAMEGPHDPNAPPGEIINCRCATVFIPEK